MRTLKFISASAIALLLSVGFVSCGEGEDSEGENTEKVLIENFKQSNITFTDQYSEQSFSFTANSSWTVTVSSNGGDTSWCAVYPESGGKGAQTVTIYTAVNSSYDDRNATITLTSGTQTKSFVVTQKQKNALLLTSDKFEVDNTGGTITVEVKANISYTTTIGSDCTDWIKEESDTRALTTTTKTFTISANEEMNKREGTITFTDGNLSETVHEPTLKSPGKDLVC
jgi:DNA gyrase/topoisomerase IV subunit A